jgi:hypothetical protein
MPSYVYGCGMASGTRNILVFLGRMAEAMGHALQFDYYRTKQLSAEQMDVVRLKQLIVFDTGASDRDR